jgi:hypothetical protein
VLLWPVKGLASTLESAASRTGLRVSLYAAVVRRSTPDMPLAPVPVASRKGPEVMLPSGGYFSMPYGDRFDARLRAGGGGASSLPLSSVSKVGGEPMPNFAVFTATVPATPVGFHRP